MIAFFILAFLGLVQAKDSQYCTTQCTTSCPFICPPSCANDSLALEALTKRVIKMETGLKYLIDRIINITIPVVEPSTYSYSSSPLLHSCEEIKTNWPDSPSDYYIIADSKGHSRHVYCHMESLCNSEEGWMRVAYLNMSDPTEECPPGFRLYNQKGIRACG